MSKTTNNQQTSAKLIRQKKEALEQLEIAELPEPCKSLSLKQKQFAENYVASLNIKQACKDTGYSYQHGCNLAKDARIRLYCNYLREQIDKISVLSKGQIVAKLGQRILSSDVSDKDLASLAREARQIQGFGSEVTFNQQINIKLPDTYNQFFSSDKPDLANAEDWQDVEHNNND